MAVLTEQAGQGGAYATTGASLNTPPLTLCREGRMQHFMAAMATQPVLDGSAESFAAIVSLPGNAKGCSLRSLLVVKPPDSKAAVSPLSRRSRLPTNPLPLPGGVRAASIIQGLGSTMSAAGRLGTTAPGGAISLAE